MVVRCVQSHSLYNSQIIEGNTYRVVDAKKGKFLILFLDGKFGWYNKYFFEK